MADFDPQEIDKELLSFLSLDARPDVKAVALQYFVGLTGNESGLSFISSNEKYLSAIINLTRDVQQPAICKDAYLALVNLTTDKKVAEKLSQLQSEPKWIYEMTKYILNSSSLYADIACSVLSNLSRNENCAEVLVKEIISYKDEIGFDMIIQVFCKENYNKHAKLDYLGMILANLTQIQETRKYILDKNHCVIQRLLPYTQYKESLMRRAGVALTLRNCCFEMEYHEWLLSDEVDILPRLLLPLAGGEEFDEEDTEKLPDDLQYLDPDKQREEDPDIRQILLEAIIQLCAAKPCRDFIKDKNTYVIMRELHKWEKDPSAMHALENLVDLLIQDEPEKGQENYREVEIPEKLQEKLDKNYKDRLLEIEQETKELELEQAKAAHSNKEIVKST